MHIDCPIPKITCLSGENNQKGTIRGETELECMWIRQSEMNVENRKWRVERQIWQELGCLSIEPPQWEESKRKKNWRCNSIGGKMG
jgi:hypothetical protein